MNADLRITRRRSWRHCNKTKKKKSWRQRKLTMVTTPRCPFLLSPACFNDLHAEDIPSPAMELCLLPPTNPHTISFRRDTWTFFARGKVSLLVATEAEQEFRDDEDGDPHRSTLPGTNNPDLMTSTGAIIPTPTHPRSLSVLLWPKTPTWITARGTRTTGDRNPSAPEKEREKGRML